MQIDGKWHSLELDCVEVKPDVVRIRISQANKSPVLNLEIPSEVVMGWADEVERVRFAAAKRLEDGPR